MVPPSDWNYNSQDAPATCECARAAVAEGERAAPTERSGWGSRGRVVRATPKEADAGRRAGAGNRGTGNLCGSVKKVGGLSGSQSGKPSLVLSRKSVCGRRQGVAPAMVAEEGEVAAFQLPAPVS